MCARFDECAARRPRTNCLIDRHCNAGGGHALRESERADNGTGVIVSIQSPQSTEVILAPYRRDRDARQSRGQQFFGHHDSTDAPIAIDEWMDVGEKEMHEDCPAEWMFQSVDDCEPGVKRSPYPTRRDEESVTRGVRLLFVLARSILRPAGHQIGVPRLDLLLEILDRDRRGCARSQIDELPVSREHVVTVLGPLCRYDAIEDDSLRFLYDEPRTLDVIGEISFDEGCGDSTLRRQWFSSRFR